MGPQILAFLPALTLAAYWVGGQTALLFMALIVPGLFAFGGLFGHRLPGGSRNLDIDTHLPHRPAVVDTLDRCLPQATGKGRTVAAMAVKLDNFRDCVRDLDDDGKRRVLAGAADRIRSALRDGDRMARLDGARFVIALTDLRNADHAMLVRIAERMQKEITEPFGVDGIRVHLTLSVGFCLPSKLAATSGEAMVEAAEAALAAARSQGAGGIRGFDADMPKVPEGDKVAIEELSRAMEAGEIQPWFQPQISAGTGQIIGFEALARWDHPRRGLVLPADFLPLIEPAGLSRRLGEVVIYGAFSLLRKLDRAGFDIARVSVNFSHAELSAPDLADRIKWELDRFDLTPDRLAVEVLESALAKDTSAVEHNLRALADLGCKIDLDDFGTGNTSIAGIRRFAIGRLKIDRSFVTRVDRDSEQASMVRAIQTMARQMELETIAEGVETAAEQATLCELGCDAVQGFVVGRPMAAEGVPAWIEAHQRKLGQAGALSAPAQARQVGKQSKTA